MALFIVTVLCQLIGVSAGVKKNKRITALQERLTTWTLTKGTSFTVTLMEFHSLNEQTI